MHVSPVPDNEIWPEGVRISLLPPDGDMTGAVRSCDAVVDAVELGGVVTARFSVRIELAPEDLAALAKSPTLWVSQIGDSFRPMNVGLLPEGVQHAGHD